MKMYNNFISSFFTDAARFRSFSSSYAFTFVSCWWCITVPLHKWRNQRVLSRTISRWFCFSNTLRCLLCSTVSPYCVLLRPRFRSTKNTSHCNTIRRQHTKNEKNPHIFFVYWSMMMIKQILIINIIHQSNIRTQRSSSHRHHLSKQKHTTHTSVMVVFS